MSRFHNRSRPITLGVLTLMVGLLVPPTDAAATAPSISPPIDGAAKKISPVSPATTAPIDSSAKQISPPPVASTAPIEAVEKIVPLTKSEKSKVAAKAGLVAKTVEQAITLTIRRPYRDLGTHLSIVGRVQVLPGTLGGTAKISKTTGVSNIFALPFSDPKDFPPVVYDHATVQFRAAPNRHYVVECSATEMNGYGTIMVDDGKWIEGGFTRVGRQIVQLVPKQAKAREVKIAFFNLSNEWVLQGCAITPMT
jgi:hypothetical protein